MRLTAVKFKDPGKIHVLRCDELDLQINDWVVVQTERGLKVAWVVVNPWETDPKNVSPEISSVIRRAEREDLEKAQSIKDQEREAQDACCELIRKYKLPMKLVEVESLFEDRKIIFYFTAESRVDFRALVKDLAHRFRCKVEMRQIGVRNEAKLLGGVGPCGRELCCTTFLANFEPVSVRMAKDQNLSLNPLKISGLCGRLMCCLSFEHDMYQDLKKRFPKSRKWVRTSRGVGRVKRLNVLADKIVLELPEGQEMEVALEEIIEVLPSKPQDPKRTS